MPVRTSSARLALAGMVVALGVAVGPAVMAASADTPASNCLLGLICPPSPTPAPTPPPPPPPPPPAPASHPSSSAGASSGAAQRVSGPALSQSVLPGIAVDPNYEIATQAAEIESNPIATQRPDLMHFHPPQMATEAGSGDASNAQLLDPTAGLIAAGIAAAVVAGLLGVMSAIVVRRRRTNPRQRRALAVAPVVGAMQAALFVVLLTGHAGAPGAGPPTATPSAELAGTVLSALRAHSVSVPVGTGSRTWGSLVSIESALTTQQDSLVSDEQQIAAITPQLTDAANAKGFARRPGALGVLRQTLRLDVADHQNQLSSFNKSLQQEYTFFVSAAQSPQAATELRSVAAHTPPDVANAVTTDLNLVQTQLQQETEIAAASGTNSLLPQLLNGSGMTFHAPVAGYVSQPFGPTSFSLEPPITYNGSFYPHFHTGLDIAAPMDTPVHAAADGVVLLATSSVDVTGHLAGYGNYVVIGHSGGFMTLYGHLDRLLVSPGQHVQAGDVIGLLGSTGWSTGPHVHFEIRKNGMYTDPVPYIRNDLG